MVHTLLICTIILISLFFYILLTVPAVNLVHSLISQPYAQFICINIPHIIILVSIIILSPLLLKRSWLSLLTDRGKFRWKTCALSMAVTLALLIIFSLFEGNAQYEEHTVLHRIRFFTAAVILIPLQCLSEELLTRTLIARMFCYESYDVSLLKKILVCSFSGIIFALLHLGAGEFSMGESSLMLLMYYFISGFSFLFITLDSGGGEEALGIHIMNNLFIACVVNYRGSAYESAPLFMKNGIPPIPLMILEMLIITASVHFTVSKSVLEEEAS